MNYTPVGSSPHTSDIQAAQPSQLLRTPPAAASTQGFVDYLQPLIGTETTARPAQEDVAFAPGLADPVMPVLPASGVMGSRGEASGGLAPALAFESQQPSASSDDALLADPLPTVRSITTVLPSAAMQQATAQDAILPGAIKGATSSCLTSRLRFQPAAGAWNKTTTLTQNARSPERTRWDEAGQTKSTKQVERTGSRDSRMSLAKTQTAAAETQISPSASQTTPNEAQIALAETPVAFLFTALQAPTFLRTGSSEHGLAPLPGMLQDSSRWFPGIAERALASPAATAVGLIEAQDHTVISGATSSPTAGMGRLAESHEFAATIPATIRAVTSHPQDRDKVTSYSSAVPHLAVQEGAAGKVSLPMPSQNTASASGSGENDASSNDAGLSGLATLPARVPDLVGRISNEAARRLAGNVVPDPGRGSLDRTGTSTDTRPVTRLENGAADEPGSALEDGPVSALAKGSPTLSSGQGTGPFRPTGSASVPAAEKGRHALPVQHENVLPDNLEATGLTSDMSFKSDPGEPAKTGADGSAGPTLSTNLFAQMDSGTGGLQPTFHSGGKTLQVSLPQNASGAVSIQAHLVAGQISASIQAAREPSLHQLARELPAMQAFLSTHQVDVKSVSIDFNHSGSGQPSDPRKEEGPQQQAQVRERRLETSPSLAPTPHVPSENTPLLSVEA